jgi:hypothetical protein
MKVFQGRRDLGSIEPGVIFGNALAGPRLQGSEEFSAAAVLHTQVEVILGLE